MFRHRLITIFNQQSTTTKIAAFSAGTVAAVSTVFLITTPSSKHGIDDNKHSLVVVDIEKNTSNNSNNVLSLLLGKNNVVYTQQANNNNKSTSPTLSTSTPLEETGCLSPNEFRKFRVLSSETVSPNTKLIRLELPSLQSTSGLTVASCVVARADTEGKVVTRPYTPVSLKDQKGHMDLLVKCYPAPGGLMSRHLTHLKPGIDYVELKGPFKKLEYKPNMYKRIGMIAGGTGITPMLQIIREILSNPEDLTQVSLIFANVTEQDILLKAELDTLSYLYPAFKVYYTLDKPPKGWTLGTGFVSKDMISKHLPPPSDDMLICVCGPKPMVELLSGLKGAKDTQGELQGLLKELGYTENQVYKF
jgi:cytochrome-b5 reductase